jgi:hypothetical protein
MDKVLGVIVGLFLFMCVVLSIGWTFGYYKLFHNDWECTKYMQTRNEHPYSEECSQYTLRNDKAP